MQTLQAQSGNKKQENNIHEKITRKHKYEYIHKHKERIIRETRECKIIN